MGILGKTGRLAGKNGVLLMGGASNCSFGTRACRDRLVLLFSLSPLLRLTCPAPLPRSSGQAMGMFVRISPVVCLLGLGQGGFCFLERVARVDFGDECVLLVAFWALGSAPRRHVALRKYKCEWREAGDMRACVCRYVWSYRESCSAILSPHVSVLGEL